MARLYIKFRVKDNNVSFIAIHIGFFLAFVKILFPTNCKL